MIDPAIFKAYDVRGTYPDQLNDDAAHTIGGAIIEHLGVSSIAVGRDMRVSGPALSTALIQGMVDQGAEVTDLGMTSTDELYFAVGKFGYPAGVMVSASHNPKDYNGFKLCREQAIPISSETGLDAIRDLAIKGPLPPKDTHGKLVNRDVLADFVAHVLSFIDPAPGAPAQGLHRCRERDGGDGRARGLRPAALQGHAALLHLDGTFPHHPASPIEPENMVDLQHLVREHRPDIGVAFDGDADRMFIIDEQGNLVDGSHGHRAGGRSLLARSPGSTILYNLICSRSVPELITELGGKAIRTRVGHSFIKAEMRENNAIFGGEHSGHFYFRDNWFADSGMIALLVVLELVSRENKPVSELIHSIDHRFRSGEINSHVKDIPAKLQELRDRFKDGQQDELDGITVNYPDWWFNVRASNTEPLIRLNVEGDTKDLMEKHRDELLGIIRE